MSVEQKGDFIVNFFNGLEAIVDFTGEVLKILFTFILVVFAVVSVLVLIGLPFYGIAGYVTSIPGKRIVFSIPFTFATVLFIAWIGSVRSKWSS